MTPQYLAYLAPARATSQVWRLVLGAMLITGVYVAWMIGMGAVFWLGAGMANFDRQMSRIGGGADPWSLILLLATFLGAWLGAAITLRVLHGRRLRTLFGRPAVVLRDFVLGVAMMVVIGGGLALVLAPFMPGLERATPADVWLRFLPLALLGILIQTGAEELVFRGYVQGQLAARFRSPVIWLTVPTILFGLAHYAPEETGANAWIVVASTGLFGLVASDLTARTGSLGLAWGLHFANNVLAILVISVMGGLDGLALLHLPVAASSDAVLRPLLLSDMVLMALVWLGCRLWLRRR